MKKYILGESTKNIMLWDGIIQALEHSDYKTIGCNTMLKQATIDRYFKDEEYKDRECDVEW